MSDRRRTVEPVEPAEPEPRRHVEIVMGHVVLIDDVCQLLVSAALRARRVLALAAVDALAALDDRVAVTLRAMPGAPLPAPPAGHGRQ